MECVSASAGPGAGPSLAGELRGHGLFRMSPGDVAALRRRPGPIPAGWESIGPSVLRSSDEQTIAGTVAVLTAIEAMGLAPEDCQGWGVVAASRYLGRANFRGAAGISGGGGVEHVAPFDPALRSAFSCGNDQPGPGIAWTEPGSWRRPPRRGRGFSGGFDLDFQRHRAGSLARDQRVESGINPGPVRA